MRDQSQDSEHLIIYRGLAGDSRDDIVVAIAKLAQETGKIVMGRHNMDRFWAKPGDSPEDIRKVWEQGKKALESSSYTVLEVGAGDIGRTTQKMLQMANARNEVIRTNFNGFNLAILPGEPAEAVEAMYFYALEKVAEAEKRKETPDPELYKLGTKGLGKPG